jgi:transposase
MRQSTTLFVGLDVHKVSVDIALADAKRDAPVRHLATVAGGLEPLTKALRRLVSRGHRLHIVYEAGPCGFTLQRHLSALGWHCDVAAPSSIPRPCGDRVKTDRRDAMKLARLARIGELTPVRVPDCADEAIRDLVRGREDAVREQRNARHRLKALLLRNGIAYSGHSAWTGAHLRGLATPHPQQQIVFQEYLHAVSEAGARIDRHEQAMRDALTTWSLAPVVAALQALRGVQLIAAMTLAHLYRYPARVSPVIARRLTELPSAVTDIAWTAQTRLCSRFRRLAARRLPHNKIVVALARELCGFVWAIARQVAPPPTMAKH